MASGGSNSSSFEDLVDTLNISNRGRIPDDTLRISDRRGKPEERLLTSTLTQRDDDYYSMGYGQKGQCHVFAYQNFKEKRMVRKCAPADTLLCKKAFRSLGYDVHVHEDLKTVEFLKEIKKIQCDDHTNRSSLVIILMTHGELVAGAEYFHTYDETILTSELWESFTADNCPTLTGKPKLFFIQACRGDSVDYGAGLEVCTDGHDHYDDSPKTNVEQYVIPSHSDMLVMFASYAGMFAFKSGQRNFNGSVFIHFLSEVLCEEGTKTDLSKLLLKITRKVALEYESYCADARLSNNKQTPQTISTLMRDVRFC